MQSKLIRFIALAISFSTATSCSESSELPTFADTDADQSCDCVLEDNCPIPEMAEGMGEDRGFQCQWVGANQNEAVCTYETRLVFDDPEIPDRNWSAISMNFKKTRSGAWCWKDS